MNTTAASGLVSHQQTTYDDDVVVSNLRTHMSFSHYKHPFVLRLLPYPALSISTDPYPVHNRVAVAVAFVLFFVAVVSSFKDPENQEKMSEWEM